MLTFGMAGENFTVQKGSKGLSLAFSLLAALQCWSSVWQGCSCCSGSCAVGMWVCRTDCMPELLCGQLWATAPAALVEPLQDEACNTMLAYLWSRAQLRNLSIAVIHAPTPPNQHSNPLLILSLQFQFSKWISRLTILTSSISVLGYLLLSISCARCRGSWNGRFGMCCTWELKLCLCLAQELLAQRKEQFVLS